MIKALLMKKSRIWQLTQRKFITYGMFFLLCGSISILISKAAMESTIESTNFPMARHGHRMVFLPDSSEIFMFGGEFDYYQDILLEGMWKYQISNNRWEMIPTVNGPSARMNPGMIYISLTNTILLFGGVDTTHYLRMNDLWEFNLDTEQWRQVETPTSPPSRSDMAIYYDEVANKAYLFGGYSASDTKLADMWEFDVSNSTWTDLNISSGPSARYGHHMVYNSLTQEGILFSGSATVYMNDLWRFNGSSHTWTEILTIHRPTVRYWHDLAFDPTYNSLYVFGGRNSQVVGDSLADTWQYDFTTGIWTEITMDVYPSQRALSYMIMDTTNSELYLFGGIQMFNEECHDDFWRFSLENEVWSEIFPRTSSSPYWIGTITLVVIGGTFIGYFIVRKKRLAPA